MKERVICGFSYLSMGMVALVYYLFKGGRGASPFFLFHFYQSILAGLFYFMFGFAVSALMEILGGLVSMIPGAPPQTIMLLGVILGYVHQALLLVLVYGAVVAFLGKLNGIPGISKLARMQMR
jgi:hypothetical protein